MRLLVSVKQLGKRKDTVQAVPLVLDLALEDTAELIAATVKVCVRDYNERKESSDILKYLTNGAIKEQADSGKVGFGVNYGDNKAEEAEAVQNALDAFRDGLFRVFLNGEELADLQMKIQLKDDDQLIFVRLTMLAGRLW